jgi:hypothetical protein
VQENIPAQEGKGRDLLDLLAEQPTSAYQFVVGVGLVANIPAAVLAQPCQLSSVWSQRSSVWSGIEGRHDVRWQWQAVHRPP